MQVRQLAQCERHATVQLVASLIEMDTRRLYLGEGCSSLFTYCTRVLRLSEHAAYGRIEAARAARRFPVILDLLGDGAITLTTVGLLASHLTPENHASVLESARHKTKREVERLAAELRPRPAIATVVRKLPTGTPLAVVFGLDVPRAPVETAAPPPVDPSATHAARCAVVAPLAPERYKVQFTITRETHDKLRCAQDLRHSVPDGDAARVFDRALTVLLEHLTKRKLAATKKPRARRPIARGSRHIPVAVKTRGVGTRRRSVRVRWRDRPLQRDRFSGVSSHDALCRGWSGRRGQSGAPLSRAQCLRSSAALRIRAAVAVAGKPRELLNPSS